TLPQVLGVVADGHRDAQGTQVPHRVALRHVGTLDAEALAVEDLRQRAHGHTADAHQVGPLAGDEKVADGVGIVHHGKNSLQAAAVRHVAKIIEMLYNNSRRAGIPYQIFYYS